jgi:hypothetical protein
MVVKKNRKCGGGLQQGSDPVHIRRAARLPQGFELLYRDTMWEASKG